MNCCLITYRVLKSQEFHWVDAVMLNDIFWHDADFLAELVGYNDFEEIMTERGKV